MDVARDEAAKCKEAARTDNNEFNIRKNFLVNAVNSIMEATCSQYNIVICTDQDHDDFQNLKGQILPMDLLNVEVATGKVVNFEVYVFDTGNYLRHGKWEQDSWWYWGQSKVWHDPAAMHVDFNNAQKKLDATAIKKQQDDDAAKTKTAAAATAASQSTQAATAKVQAPANAADAPSQAADAAQAQADQAPGGAQARGAAYPVAPLPGGGYPAAPASGGYGVHPTDPSLGGSPYGAAGGYDAPDPSGGAGGYGAPASAAPAPGLMDRKFWSTFLLQACRLADVEDEL